MIAFPRACMVAVRMFTMLRWEMWFSPMRWPLSMRLLPWRSHVLLRFHIAAELRVNFGDHIMCGHPCLAVDSPDDTLETIASVEILFGEIYGHCLLFQGDLIFEILDKVLQPIQLG